MKDIIDINVFKKDLVSYLSKPDPIKEYIKQTGVFLNKVRGIPYEEAVNRIKKVLKNGNIVNPIVKYISKQENGDTIEETDTLTNYIKISQDNHEVIAPSFTTYVHPDTKVSLHSSFININVKARKEDKKLAFMYKQQDNKEKAEFHNVMQKTRKIFNNSLSGSYASNGTILYNPSAHYTLTSITRSVSSIGNSITESMVAGNKLFKDPESVFNYITSIITYIDFKLVKEVIEKYKLHIPTIEEIMDMIQESCKWYWNIPSKMGEIEYYLSKLNDLERAAVLYTNDMYHMRKYNSEVIRDMITKTTVLKTNYSEDNLKDINNAPEGVANHAHNICSDLIKGMDINYDNMKGTKELDAIASTTKYASEMYTEYKDLYHAFFITEVAPINIAYMKEMMRKCIVLSDTDSTCGAYDEWVKWYFEEDIYASDAKHIAVASTVMTIVTQVMDHYIKILCGNMNIAPDRFELLKMKNEFYWYSFVTTNMTKHYFADIGIQEGRVFATPDAEIKGVNLIASKVDISFRNIARDMMDEVKRCNREGEQIDLFQLIKKVADTERDVIKRLRAGDIRVFITNKIKPAGAYSEEPTKSNYVHYLMWEEVFSEKYGHAMEPTYQVIKVPTILDTKKKFNEYLDNIEDKNISNKLKMFMEKIGRDNIGTFWLPSLLIQNNGIPNEIIEYINYKKIVNDNCNMLYTLLESLGFYKPKGILVSEMGPY